MSIGDILLGALQGGIGGGQDILAQKNAEKLKADALLAQKAEDKRKFGESLLKGVLMNQGKKFSKPVSVPTEGMEDLIDADMAAIINSIGGGRPPARQNSVTLKNPNKASSLLPAATAPAQNLGGFQKKTNTTTPARKIGGFR